MTKLSFGADLNGPQLKAVTTLEGPVLIIAGAGSGKTRVITYRIARMLEKGIPQAAILALTFTNKAAREMESRVKELTGKKLQSLTVSTFHAFGVKILRDEIEALGFRKNFSIYDRTDQDELLKESLRECRLSTDDTDIYNLAQLFSKIKTGDLHWGNTGADSVWEPVYKEYQQRLKIFNALDFDDLLTLPLEIFENNPAILEKYRHRYRYIMVDEFQDTSLIQYKMLKILGDRNVCVVGDDDQSIYSWRGANYENILMFEKDFPGVEEIKLEQNYRSTTTILEAANGVISNNTNRKEKTLWSGNDGGKAIELFHPQNESDEADFITARIKEIKYGENRNYDDFGVLLRTNFHFRSIEEAFLAEKIPYRLSGGRSFFQQKEIKDILSYLRIIANPDDDVNLLRIINTPRRGIGKTTVQRLTDLARKNHSSLWDAMGRLRYAPDTLFEDKGKPEIDEFMGIIELYREEILGRKNPAGGKWFLSASVKSLTDKIDYWGYLVTEFHKNEKAARWKFSNIDYLVQLIERWEEDPDNLDAGLYPYLNRISLISRDENEDEDRGKVNLMTIHASKGLEFPVVFIAGVEDGIIPHARSIEEGEANMEEERRLFYVAITRARDKLFITSCMKRHHRNELVESGPSPFLTEIPPHLVTYHEGEKPEEKEAATEDFLARAKARYS